MKQLKIKPKFCLVVSPNNTEKELDQLAKLVDKGDLQSMLELIMHNQSILNYKLDKLSTNTTET